MSTSQSPQPAGVWVVSRKVRIPSLSHEADGVTLARALEATDGVKRATPDLAHHRLKIRYDASVIDYRALVIAMEEHGFPPARNWLARLKGNWYQFTDSNVRENANLPPPACCNKAPKKR